MHPNTLLYPKMYEGDIYPMRNATAVLAQSITWAGSKQTYYVARLMVDKHLVDDFLGAYAYFRWIDDFIDVSSKSKEERITFIKRQRELIERLYRNKKLENSVVP